MAGNFVLLFIFGISLLVLFLRQTTKNRFIGGAIVALILGWRGVNLINEFKIYPSEALIILGSIAVLVKPNIHRTQNNKILIPISAWILLFTSCMGIITALANYHAIDYVFLDAKSFLIFLPTLVIIGYWVNTEEEVTHFVNIFVVTGTIIASMGLLEYFFPSLSDLLPIIFSADEYTRVNFNTGMFIELASFRFWGTPVVSVLLVPILGLCTVPLAKSKSKLAWFFCELIILLGIIVSGYRSAWIGAGVVLVGKLFFGNRKTALLLLFGLFLAIIFVAPEAYLARAESLFAVGESVDATFIRRSSALFYTINIILKYPLSGTGWFSLTPFNDWVYIGLSQGIIALAFFIGWFLNLLWKLLQKLLNGRYGQDYLAIGFLISLSGYAVSMFSGAMTDILLLWSAFWLIFCLAWRYCELPILNWEERNV